MSPRSFDSDDLSNTWFAADAHCDSEKLARLRDQLAAFLKITSIIGSEQSIEAVLKIICDRTSFLMRCERTTIFLVENDPLLGPCLNSIIAENAGVIRVKFGQGIAGTVAQNQTALNIKDVYKSPLFDPSFDKKNNFITRSCLAMPILNIQKELLGVVQVINKLNGSFNADDMEMLASICSQIGVCLTQHSFYASLIRKNEELYEAREDLQRKNDELDMLYALEREAATALDLNTLVERSLAKCLPAFRVDCAAILILNESSPQLFSLKSQEKCTVSTLSEIPGIFNFCLRLSEPVRLLQIDLPELPELAKTLFECNLRELIVVPLAMHDKNIGALFLGALNPGSDRTSSYDLKLASIFAAHIAPAVTAQLDRSENEKKQRLLAIGQMMSSLMHDMKTPLANISGYSELMVMQNDPDKRAAFAQIVDRQVETLKSMSAEVLMFSRGQTSVILRKNPLHALIADAVEYLSPEAEKRHIKLTCAENFHGSIYYDEQKFLRVIINLAKNAMEAIGQNGNISIETSANENNAFITIRDDGPGIPPDIAQTLFDAFVTSGKQDGTGLGLSIVKKIVDEHHASIQWFPVEPHGTSFVMAFPLS